MLEKLLTILTALVAAIEANTAAQLGNASKKATTATPKKADTPAPTEDPTPDKKSDPAPSGVTMEALRAVAQELLDQGGLAKIKEVNAKLGIKKVSECPPEKYEELFKALSALKSSTDSAV